jgi:hypothetical protein
MHRDMQLPLSMQPFIQNSSERISQTKRVGRVRGSLGHETLQGSCDEGDPPLWPTYEGPCLGAAKEGWIQPRI